MNYIAAIFDMDGLLIDSERPALEAFEITCEHHDVGDSQNLYARLLGTNQATTQDILHEELAEHINQQGFLDMWENLYRERIDNGIPLMNGVERILDYLDQHGILLAVATSTHTDRAFEKLERVGILDRFLSVTGGDQVANGKPAPDIYLKAAITLQADPVHCIALEDSPNGVRAAVAAGMHAIQIPQLVEPDEALLRLGHQVLGDLEAVPNYLDSLRRNL